MTREEESVYEKRDFMLGQIHERTAHIPQMMEDINKLGRKVAIIEVKSGIFGVLGGILAIAGLYLKQFISSGGR